jgi:PIN domain nuclease of toxin-antitoxin system
MNQYVTDTMAIVLYLEKRRMPQLVKQIFQSADVGLCTLFIPAIVVAEIGYLSEKGRISLSLADLRLHTVRYAAYQFQPLTLAIIEESYKISDIPELHDRLIAGTARSLSIPLLTNDPIIRASKFLTTVWL